MNVSLYIFGNLKANEYANRTNDYDFSKTFKYFFTVYSLDKSHYKESDKTKDKQHFFHGIFI